jgi:hypothetical protein
MVMIIIRAATNLRLKYYRAATHRSPTPETTSRAATHPHPIHRLLAQRCTQGTVSSYVVLDTTASVVEHLSKKYLKKSIQIIFCVSNNFLNTFILEASERYFKYFFPPLLNTILLN